MNGNLLKFVEYIGPKDKKIYYSSDKSKQYTFKANPDFDNRKVCIVEKGVAEQLLKYQTVFREIELSEIVRDQVKGGNQADVFEKQSDRKKADSGSQSDETIKKDRQVIEQKAKKKR